MKKKRNYLLPLLMAIVMMAMDSTELTTSSHDGSEPAEGVPFYNIRK